MNHTIELTAYIELATLSSFFDYFEDLRTKKVPFSRKKVPVFLLGLNTLSMVYLFHTSPLKYGTKRLFV